MKLMDRWLTEERLCILNTAPPHLPLAPATKGNVVAAEVSPSKVPEQKPHVYAEEGEVMAFNPPSIMEEPINEVASGFMGNQDLINLDEEEEPTAAVDNDPPA